MTPNTRIFVDLLKENRAALTVSAAEYGAGEEAVQTLSVLPDSLLGILIRHCGDILCANGLLRLYGANQIVSRSTKDGSRFAELLFVGDLADGGLFAVSRIDTPAAKRGELLYIAPGSLCFEPMEIDSAEFIRWAMNSREETLRNIWLTHPVLSPRALEKHITAKLDLLSRLDMLKTEVTA